MPIIMRSVRRLSRPIRSQQAIDLARPDDQRQAVHGHEIVIALADFVQFYGIYRHVHTSHAEGIAGALRPC